MMIVGPSGSGKTSFLAKHILYDTTSLLPTPQRIVYHYHTEQPGFLEMYNKVLEIRGIRIQFKKGLDAFCLDDYNPKENNLICFDDLFQSTKDSDEVAKLWYIGSHHRSITAILISHNLFPKGKVARELALNTHYLVIFSHPADRQSFRILMQRLEPTKWRAYVNFFEEDLFSKPHQHLLIDLRPETNPRLKYRTGLGRHLGHIYTIKGSCNEPDNSISIQL